MDFDHIPIRRTFSQHLLSQPSKSRFPEFRFQFSRLRVRILQLQCSGFCTLFRPRIYQQTFSHRCQRLRVIYIITASNSKACLNYLWPDDMCRPFPKDQVGTCQRALVGVEVVQIHLCYSQVSCKEYIIVCRTLFRNQKLLILHSRRNIF